MSQQRRIEIGSALREARLRRGLDLGEAQRATRIRARYLDALEAERFDLLPGEFYTRSCLREYAELLGLDGDLLVEEYRKQFPEPEEAVVARPIRRRRWPVWSPARAAFALTAVAIVVAVLVLAFRPSATPEPVAAPAKPAVHHRAKPKVAAVHHRPVPVRHHVRRAAPHRLVLRAAGGDCWLSVHAGSRDGPSLYEGILREGAVLRFKRPLLWIRIGAPSNLDVRLNGKRIRLGGGSPLNVLVSRSRLAPA